MQFVRLEPDQAPNEGGSVFSSSGDIIRKGVPPPEEAKIGRSTGHGARKLLRTAASGAALIAEGVFAAFFPSDCRLCGAPLTNISRLPVCLDCLRNVVPLTGASCEVCGEGISGAVLDKKICAACEESRPHFMKATAYGAYDDELRELIHPLKYERVESAAKALGEMLAEAIQKLGPMADGVLVVPVPLYRSKRRERGFNQAELIARTAIKRNAMSGLKLATDVLARTRPTVSQIGLTRPQRVENMRGAFRVVHPNTVAGSSVILVDDVLTTGTTASECARVLRRAGAEKVWVEGTRVRERKIYAAECNDRKGIMSMSHRHSSGGEHTRHSVTAAVFGIGVGIGVHQDDDVHALHAPVLVLNASYEPINVCAARRAIVLVLKGVAMTEEENGHFLHAARLALRVPSVIRLLEYRRIPHQTRALSRKNILLRDRNTCQYCGEVMASGELTLDHVVPRSRGGASSWENLVACCHPCNRSKGNQMPIEAGMKLMREPHAFNLHTSRHIMRLMGRSDDRWRKYLFY